MSVDPASRGWNEHRHRHLPDDVTLTDVQTLTNKTFTSPHLTSVVVDSGGLTITAGNVGIGVATNASNGLQVVGSLTTSGTAQYGVNIQPVMSSAATSEITGVLSTPATAAAAFSCTTVTAFHATTPTKGAGSTITNAYGLLVDAITSGNTNNYGVYIGAPSGGSGVNYGIYTQGALVIAANVAPPAVAAGELAFTSQALVATATTGANGAPPAQVAGYLIINLGGAVRKIPLYNN